MDLKTLKRKIEDQGLGVVCSDRYLMMIKDVIIKGFVRDCSYSGAVVYNMTFNTSEDTSDGTVSFILVKKSNHPHFLQFCLSHNLTVQ